MRPRRLEANFPQRVFRGARPKPKASGRWVERAGDLRRRSSGCSSGDASGATLGSRGSRGHWSSRFPDRPRPTCSEAMRRQALRRPAISDEECIVPTGAPFRGCRTGSKMLLLDAPPATRRPLPSPLAMGPWEQRQTDIAAAADQELARVFRQPWRHRLVVSPRDEQETDVAGAVDQGLCRVLRQPQRHRPTLRREAKASLFVPSGAGRVLNSGRLSRLLRRPRRAARGHRLVSGPAAGGTDRTLAALLTEGRVPSTRLGLADGTSRIPLVYAL